MNNYEYIIVFSIVEKPVFDFKIKRFSGPSSFVVLEILFNKMKNNYCHIQGLFKHIVYVFKILRNHNFKMFQV